MKQYFLRLILFFLPLAKIQANQDQLLTIFGSNGYILYKVLDFATDHGFRYVKILSYEFTGFGHTLTGRCHGGGNGGRFFELKDENSIISFLCFEEPPQNDPYIVDSEKYHSILEDIAVQAEGPE